ncbi:MAG: DNA polymerase III subunit alpha, partial [Blastocatellia bacterium]
MDKPTFKSRDFVHLHLHSDYSLLQSTIQLKPLANRLAELEMKACAITDYGNLYGAVSYYAAMQYAGIRPIIGYDAFVASGSRLDKSSSIAAGEKPHYSLVLLAKNTEGYQNLVYLASKAFTEGLHHKPRIDMELLAERSNGLICLSGGRDGALWHYLHQNDEEKAISIVKKFREIFGEENFYLEIQNHGIDDEAQVVKKIVEVGKKNNIPLVATNDAHYLTRDDARAHEVLLCIGDGRTLNEEQGYTFGSDHYFVRSAGEMWDIFGDELPESLTNTLKVTEMCELELLVGEKDLTLPSFPIPLDSGCNTLDDYLKKITADGFEERAGTVLLPMQQNGALRNTLDDYRERLEIELAVISKMGYAGYFLIVWEFIKYAVGRDIPVGPGRGSAAGSLVAYCLGITGIDPLQYDLLFERFLNPARVSMPDIDIDFCIRGRADVINHVSDFYGRDSVCQIITFGTMASKAAIKDVGRALNMPYGDVERIAKLIPPPVRGRNVSISQALEQVAELKAATVNDHKVKNLLDLALRLEGCSRHSSVHAAGVVISPKPLHEIVPVAISAKNELTSQYSMNDLEKV